MSMMNMNRRGAIRTVTKPATTRSAAKAAEPTGSIDFVFDLPTGLDALEKSEGIEKHEYTVPFDVICLFDEAEDGKRTNVRFCTSGRSIADKAGTKHRMVADFRPILSDEEKAGLPASINGRHPEGRLTVKVATLGSNDIKWTPFARLGRYTGDLKVEFTCAAEFVEFKANGKTADKVDDPDAED